MALEEDDRREWEQQERLSVGRDYKRQGRDAVGAPPSYEQATSPDVGGGEKGTMRRRRRSSTDSARSDTVR